MNGTNSPQFIWFVPWVFNPPVSGAPIRTYHLIRDLADQRTLVVRPVLPTSHDSPYPRLESAPQERTYQIHPISRWRVWNPASRPFRGKGLTDICRELANARVDMGSSPLIIFESGYQAAPVLQLARQLRASVIYSSHNCEADVWRQLHQSASGMRRRLSTYLARIEIEREEREAVRHCAVSWCCSDTDARMFDGWDPGRNDARWVVPNGVNPDVIAYQDPAAAEQHTLCYIGYLGTDQNHEACIFLLDQLMPLIRDRLGDVRVVLAGRDARPDLRARTAAGVEIISPLDHPVHVLRRARLSVIPLFHGGGTRLKILESLSAGRPVVATSKAVEGLNCKALKGLTIADSANALAEATIEQLNAPLSANKALAIREAVLRIYDWRIITTDLKRRMCARFPEAST